MMQQLTYVASADMSGSFHHHLIHANWPPKFAPDGCFGLLKGRFGTPKSQVFPTSSKLWSPHQ